MASSGLFKTDLNTGLQIRSIQNIPKLVPGISVNLQRFLAATPFRCLAGDYPTADTKNGLRRIDSFLVVFQCFASVCLLVNLSAQFEV